MTMIVSEAAFFNTSTTAFTEAQETKIQVNDLNLFYGEKQALFNVN